MENKIAGFEYWSNVHITGNGLNWHVDKDEKLMKEKKEIVMPNMGLVYYAISEGLDGGYLEIANSPDRENVEPHKIERLKPIENRLIMFNFLAKRIEDFILEINSGLSIFFLLLIIHVSHIE